MRKLLVTLSIVFLFFAGHAQHLTPRQEFPGLFEAVQMSGIFPDNKTFVDCTPKRDPSLVMQDYNAQKDQTGFDLKKFINKNFIPPAGPRIIFKTDITTGIRKHIDTLWEVLSRSPDSSSKYSSLLPLPYPYIVPGGRFREMYYWDSYFTMLGLQESHRVTIIQNMISNFAYLIDTYGFIPNGTRTYYLTRSQPPFFSMMLDILAKDQGDAVLAKYQPELLKEYQFWMVGASKLKPGEAYRNSVRMADGEIMNRYWDASDQPREESYKKDVDAVKLTKEQPGEFYRNVRAAAESGWDFSTRWMDTTGRLESIETTFIVPVDLNCLMYHLELSIARSYKIQGKTEDYQKYLTKAEARKKAILKYSWSEKNGWFMDYNWKEKRTTPVETLAGMFPLEFKIADQQQATKAAAVLKSKFFKSGGLVTTLNRSGQQWDSPNAWAPLQYMSIDGLNNYNQKALAKDIATTWIQTNLQVFNETGKLMEKYNVVDTNTKAGGGEYPLQDGFGWTNGVLLNLMDKYYQPQL